jgi:hypothetical protein
MQSNTSIMLVLNEYIGVKQSHDRLSGKGFLLYHVFPCLMLKLGYHKLSLG